MKVIDPHGCADYKLPAEFDPRNELTELDVRAAALSDDELYAICAEIGRILGVGPLAEDAR